MDAPTLMNKCEAQTGLDGLLKKKKDIKLTGTGDFEVDLGDILEMCGAVNMIKIDCMKFSRN